tara:strand:- start:9687 stop:10580 length:894 start_codon:yes stop_codon:yes gene_type:complete
MQYNVEWLFLDYYKNSDCPGNGCTWKNKTMANTHIQYISNVINKFNPDIINLCEVEGCDELNMVIKNTSNNYNPYLIKGTDTSTGQNVGMLTKLDPINELYHITDTYHYPISNSKCNYNGSGNVGVSKNYVSLFKWNDINVAFISIHLLAYPTDHERCSKREAQAKIIENLIIDYTNKNYEIFIIGDFNDYDNDIMDINNSKPISQVLDIIKGKQNDVYNLTNVAYNVPQKYRYTNWWDKNNNCYATMDEFVLIDHILVSDLLLSKIKDVYIYHGYTESCDRLNSDHYPIIIDIDYE